MGNTSSNSVTNVCKTTTVPSVKKKLDKEIRDTILIHIYNDTCIESHHGSNIVNALIDDTYIDIDVHGNGTLKNTCEYFMDIVAQCIRKNNATVLYHIHTTWTNAKSLMDTFYYDVSRYLQYFEGFTDDKIIWFVLTNYIPYPKKTDVYFRYSVYRKLMDKLYKYHQHIAMMFISDLMRVSLDIANNLMVSLLGSPGYKEVGQTYKDLYGLEFKLLDSHIVKYLQIISDNANTHDWRHFLTNIKPYIDAHGHQVPLSIRYEVTSHLNRDMVNLLVLLIDEYPDTPLFDLIAQQKTFVGVFAPEHYERWVKEKRIPDQPKDALINALVCCNADLIGYLLKNNTERFCVSKHDLQYVIKRKSYYGMRKEGFKDLFIKVVEECEYNDGPIFVSWNQYNLLEFEKLLHNIELFEELRKRNCLPELTIDVVKHLLIHNSAVIGMFEDTVYYIHEWLITKGIVDDEIQKELKFRHRYMMNTSFGLTEKQYKFEWEP